MRKMKLAIPYTGNPLLEIKGNGRLIRDGACAINLCLDRHLRFR